ncbi:hypothetical protein, partial [Methylosinus sp. sav-2]|uniref:hypothetical protein n=1 Tax=Methylosinus sp. sav-2 TaxID=2485168 RepID=UPI001AB05847
DRLLLTPRLRAYQPPGLKSPLDETSGARQWDEEAARDAVYANRARLKSGVGRAAMRQAPRTGRTQLRPCARSRRYALHTAARARKYRQTQPDPGRRLQPRRADARPDWLRIVEGTHRPRQKGQAVRLQTDVVIAIVVIAEFNGVLAMLAVTGLIRG